MELPLIKGWFMAYGDGEADLFYRKPKHNKKDGNCDGLRYSYMGLATSLWDALCYDAKPTPKPVKIRIVAIIEE